MLPLVLTAPAQAGFLEDLFGGDDTPQAAPAPRARAARPTRAARSEFSIRINEGRRASRTADRKATDADGDHRDYVAGSRPQKPRLCAPAGETKETAEATTTAYLRDETLRAGDSVVTDGDIVVFKGRSACPHTARDFVSLARSDLPKAKRNALAALEQTMRAPPRAFVHEREKEAGPRVVGQVSQ